MSMSVFSFLPHLNAILNSVTIVLLLAGFILIHRSRQVIHHRVMVMAIIVSTFFLTSYLTYHFTAPLMVFPGKGWIRPVYYTIMITHIILAVVIIPLAVATSWRALHGHFKQHRTLARWTLPAWLYVSVTGVIIYVTLYHIYAPSAR